MWGIFGGGHKGRGDPAESVVFGGAFRRTGPVRRPLRWLAVALTVVTASGILAACGSGGSSAVGTTSTASSSNGTPKSGGSLTVLEAQSLYGTWAGLDPLTDQDSTEVDFLDPIYGDLFLQGLNGKIIYDLATGYKYLNGGMQVAIYLRHGVTFQDGTPFNAAAVAFNINRDLNPKYACFCDLEFPVTNATTSGNYTVILNMKHVDNAVIPAFFQNVFNWIVSPTALKKEGDKAFGQHPVGAGPFEVVKNVDNSKLVLKRNPNYWQKGLPYLNSLTFEVIGSDGSAFDALLTGEAQVYNLYTSYSNLKSVAKKVTVTGQPAKYGNFIVMLNSTTAPFNNITAREAIYYATNAQAINKAVADGYGTVSQSLSSPGSLFEELTVPGYPTYNLAKAKAIVHQLGGLSIGLLTPNDPGEVLVAEALKSEWAQAGIKTNLQLGTGVNIAQSLNANKWQTELGRYGGSDPALFTGLPLLMKYAMPKDKTVAAMAQKATETLSNSVALKDYEQIYKYIAQEAYLPVLFSVPFYDLSVHGVSGPGLTTRLYEVLWQDVTVKS